MVRGPRSEVKDHMTSKCHGLRSEVRGQKITWHPSVMVWGLRSEVQDHMTSKCPGPRSKVWGLRSKITWHASVVVQGLRFWGPRSWGQSHMTFKIGLKKGNFVMSWWALKGLLDLNKAYSGILTVGTYFWRTIDSLLEGLFQGFLVVLVISELIKPFYNYSLITNCNHWGFVSILHFVSLLLIW